MIKVYNPHYICAHTQPYIRKSVYMHIHASTQKTQSISYNYSTEVRIPSKLSTHNLYVQGLQITNVVCSAKH